MTQTDLPQIGTWIDNPLAMPLAVCAHEVSVKRRGDMVLHDINFYLEDGVFLGIIGPNGGGKSTLLQTIAGLIRPKYGLIEVYGSKPQALNHRRFRIGYVPQECEIDEEFPATVYDVILSGAFASKRRFLPLGHEVRGRAQQLMALLNLDHLAKTPFGKISQGQQRQAFIARAMVCQPQLLLMDEPMNGLDASAQAQVMRLLMDFKEQFGLTVIMTSHDIRPFLSFCKYFASINGTMTWHERSDFFHPRDEIPEFYDELGAILKQRQNKIRFNEQPFHNESNPSVNPYDDWSQIESLDDGKRP